MKKKKNLVGRELIDPMGRYPNYALSSDGRMYGRGRWGKDEWKELSGTIVWNGYRSYTMYDEDGVPFAQAAHRLVAATFIGPVPEGMWVCHINGDKTDNRVENLRIGTASSNTQDMLRHKKKRGEPTNSAKLTAKEAKLVYDLYVSGGRVKDIAERFSVDRGTVWGIGAGRQWAWATGAKR